jgi:hypothetical protein
MPAISERCIDLNLDEFEAVEQAVRETQRGRWFLDEFSKRARQSETLGLMESLRKIERVMMARNGIADAEAISSHLDRSSVLLKLLRGELGKQEFPVTRSIDAMLDSVDGHLRAIEQITEGQRRASASDSMGKSDPTVAFNFDQDSMMFS